MSWTEEDVKKLFCNPIYVGMGPYTAATTEEEWIRVAVKYIKENGAEDFLKHMIVNLREAFEPGAAPYGYKKKEG